MGFLKDLFSRPQRTEDPVFGEIAFQQKAGFWEGRAEIDSQDVELLLDAQADGPSDDQRRYFREFSLAYPALKHEIASHLLRSSGAAGWRLVCLDLQSNPFVGSAELTYEISVAGVLLSHIERRFAKAGNHCCSRTLTVKHWEQVRFTSANIALPRQALCAFRPAGNSTPPPVALARSGRLRSVSAMLQR